MSWQINSDLPSEDHNQQADLDHPSLSGCCSHHIDQGLFLEDHNILLPWGARRYHLIGLCRPDRLVQTAGWDEFFWHSPRLLNGLKTHLVQVVLYPYGWLDETWIWLERGESIERANAIFSHSSRHLAAIFGRPSQSEPDQQCEIFSRLSAWEWRETRLSLFVRAGDLSDDYQFCTVAHIARRPEGCIPAPP
jgi:hypothetical protein